MIIQLVNPRKSLNKAFLKQKPLRSEIELFKLNLIRLLDKIDEIEHEENQKNHIRDFLRDTFYKETNEINTKDTKDLVIHLGKSNKEKVGVIIEAKRPGNKTEMISMARPNSKALQELVLYYLRERIEENNIDIKYLIATNVYEWYIFEAATFEKLFYRNKSFVKQYEQWRDGQKVTRDTNLFYNDIARPFIDTITDEITCTHFDIRKYETILRNENKEDDKSLIALQKLLSPNHLLKIPFTNDSNSLNEKFYKELLHIIGLEEVKEGSKNIIRRKIANRQSGSLIENTINILETDESLRRIRDRAAYGETRDEQLFNIALELCLTWINRVLFLKLLEGQLITYHRGDPDYRFLNSAMIVDYDELYKLFHQVLARNVSERTHHIQQKYSRVPYLNSSLFEISELEDLTIKINSLDDSETIELTGTTILKDERKKTATLPTLQYLFKFLDAYDFASEGGEDIAEDNKTIINASVLGKVFEKINGYKDGSIFTPGFITMYMSRQSLRPAVIQKFNEHFKTVGIAEATTFEELYNRVDKVDIKAANAIVNSLRVCDPAVGSGHFLVSALNELILIKSELGILADKQGKRLRDYEFTIENDELIVTDQHGLFVYNHLNKESQRVQETIFGERQTIIENCLFGVDINPNSVKICRLRLWIELLKSAYYKSNPAVETGYSPSPQPELETLPNIDINIKCGNSLISRYALDADIKKTLKRSKWSIESYRIAIMSYRNARSKDEKRDLEDLITAIKTDFETEVSTSDKRFIRFKKAKDDLFNLTNQGQLFEKSKKEVAEWNKKVAELSAIITRLEKEIEEIKNNVIYKNAFEWRFEFPEVLNDEGDFVGFDVVIGNPPYGASFSNSIKQFYKEFYSNIHVRTPESFNYFISRFIQIGNSESIVSLIIPSSFLNQIEFEKTRKYLLDNYRLKELINLGDGVFAGITAPTCVIIINKGFPQEEFLYSDLTKIERENLSLEMKHVNFKLHSKTFNNNTGYNFIYSQNKGIIDKCYLNKPTLKDIAEDVATGISPGLGEAFVIKMKEALENKFESIIVKKLLIGGEINRFNISPKSGKGIIYFTNNVEINEFPYVLNHLENFRVKLEQRVETKSGLIPWYVMLRPRRNKLFELPKILVRQTANRIMAAFDPDGWYCLKSGLIIQLPEKTELSYFYLLALLNSTLMDYLYRDLVNEDNRVFPEVKTIQLFKLPIATADLEAKTKIENLIMNIIEAKKQGQDTLTLEMQVDELVYGLYGITEEERMVIEGEK